MPTTWSEATAEIERLKIENEGLRAQLIAAKASPAAAKRASDVPMNWGNMRLAMLALVSEEATAAGFDGASQAGRDAWYAWRFPEMAAARAAARGAPAKVAERPAPVAEPAPVRQRSFEEVTQATPEGVLRALAIAKGTLVELPANETARAILRAHQKASDPDARPL